MHGLESMCREIGKGRSFREFFWGKRKKPAKNAGFLRVVAGAGFEPTTFGL